MTQAFNLSQLANNLNSSGQLDATDGLNGLVPIANGGTNANNASSARTNLGVAISSDVMPWVAPSTAGNVLTSNGSVWTSATPSAGGGSYVYLGSASASASTTIEFTGLDTTTYNGFLVYFGGVRHSTSPGSNWLRVRFYINGTIMTTSNYFYGGWGNSTDSSATYTGSFQGGISYLNMYQNSGLASTTAGTGHSGWFVVSNVAGSGLRNFAAGQGSGTVAGSTATIYSWTWSATLTNTTGIVNGVQFSVASGNMAVGNFRIYGLKNS